MLENNIDLAFIQEPYLVECRIALFPLNFQIISSEDRPKAAIVINPKTLKIMILERFTSNLDVFALVMCNDFEFYCVSSYMPPTIPINQCIDRINFFLNEVSPQEIVICSDTNAKSKVWFSPTNSLRGEDLLEFVIQNNLIILNNCKTPTFLSPSGQSNIDLTLVNVNSFNKINKWKVEDIETNSDHSYITFELDVDVNNNNNIININNEQIPEIVTQQLDKKYVTKKLEFKVFKDKTELKLLQIKSQIESSEDIIQLNSVTECLIQTMIEFCNQNLLKHKTHKKSHNWWTTEISDKRKTVNRLRRRYQRTKDRTLRQINKVEYYTEKSIYESLIKASKIRSWKKLCKESNTWEIPYKIMNNKMKSEKSFPNFIKSDGQFTKTIAESMEYALTELFPSDNNLNESPIHEEIRRYVNTCPDTENDILFTPQELEEIIHQLRPNKSPGWDQLNDQIVKCFHQTDPELLLMLFNKCLQLGYFPKILKISVIKILIKNADKSRNDIKNYRPISLLCVIAKVFEKLIINRINHYLYCNQLLSTKQF